MHMKSLPAFLAICLFCMSANAQVQKKWDLKSIVDYAMANNITVKMSEVQAKMAHLTYKQSKASQLPTLIMNDDGGINSGTNQDPVTFNRVTETYFSSGLQVQSSADIFNFFSKRNVL